MKTVLITGAGSGLGRQITLEFVKKGYTPILVSKSKESLKELADSIKAQYYVVDISDKQQVQTLKKQLVKKNIHIDCLINNAGIGAFGTIKDTKDDTIKSLMDVNYFGTINMTMAFIEDIRAQNGTIVFINSIAGKILIPKFGAYCASKFALDCFSRTLAQEEDFRVINVYPGPMSTNFYNNESFSAMKVRFLFSDPAVIARIIVKKIVNGKKIIVVPSYLFLLLVMNRISHSFTRFVFRNIYKI